jgi:8-oxo-dGTP diphosphatase
MHFGEGPIDCLKREAREEFKQEIEVIQHFYTTDFFQPSQFHDDQQLIAVYYKARFIEPERFRICTIPFDFPTPNEEIIAFRYRKISAITVEELSFPVDRHVMTLLKKQPI